MNNSIRNCVFVAVFSCVSCLISVNSVYAANGWRWAKPLNQKPGSLFYTGNRANKSQVKSQTWSRMHHSTRVVTPRVYRQPVYATPMQTPSVIVHEPGVTIHSAITTPVPSSSASGVPMPSPTPAVPPAATTSTMTLGQWIGSEVASPE